jgi:hypothetical protein
MGMATFCGLRRKRYAIAYQALSPDTAPITLRSRSRSKSSHPQQSADTANPTSSHQSLHDVEKKDPEKEVLFTHSNLRKKTNSVFEWSREDQLSVILEILSEKGDTPIWEKTEAALNWEQIPKLSPSPPSPRGKGKRTRWIDHEYPGLRSPESIYPPTMSSSRGRESPITPRSIEPPPTDVCFTTCYWTLRN